MAPVAVTLGGIANVLLSHPTVRRSAIITAPGTGNATLDEIELRLARRAAVLKYEHLDELDELARYYKGSLDLVIVDPIHNYESSVGSFERCLQLLRSGGILLSHDCVPSPDTTNPERTIALEWCGVTFAAFRDVMTARGVRWCTLAADFGLGLAVVPSAGVDQSPAMDSTAPWTPASHRAYLERYLADPFSFMRTVRAEAWRTAIDRLRVGEGVNDLAAEFNSWDDLRPSRPVAQQRTLRSVLRAVGRRL